MPSETPTGRLGIIHLIRNTFRYASKRYWQQIATDLKRIYRAPARQTAWAAFEEFEEKWAKTYPAIGQLWRAAWEPVPFLDYDVEICTVLCSTNAIESLSARYRRESPCADTSRPSRPP